MFIDSHCHLGFPDLGSHTDKTLQFLSCAKESEIGLILDIATDLDKFKEYLDFANKIIDFNKYPKIYTAIGIHPLHIESNPNFSIEDFNPYLNDTKLIAIGETGFDRNYPNYNITKQRYLFEIHANIAIQNKLPIIIHSRLADNDTINGISYFISKYDLKGVIHCFTGNVDFAKKILDLGFYVSFSGISTFKNAKDLHEVIKYVPADKILIETDAPYLAPVPHRGSTNEPSFVKYTYDYVSKLRSEDIEYLKQYVKKNFQNLFTKAIT